MNLKVYGCRGSIPLSHTGGCRYGGNTSCMVIESNGEFLVFDAGSGLIGLEKDLRKKYKDYPALPSPLNLIVSHLHLDHIIGLASLRAAWNKDNMLRIHSARSGDNLIEQILKPFEPPYWPVSMAENSTVECIYIEPGVPFKVGCFTIIAFLANHTDETYSYHVTDGEKTFVHLLDSEVATTSKDTYDELIEFCKDADMIIFDGAYSPDDYHEFVGWGHSTVLDGIKLARETNCKKMIFSHFAQFYTDDALDSWKKYFDTDQFLMAYDGMELQI